MKFTYTLTLETSVDVDPRNMLAAVINRLGNSVTPPLGLVNKLDVTPQPFHIAEDDPAEYGVSGLTAEETTSSWKGQES